MQVDINKIRETNAFSCLECGKCTGTCPVARYSSTFSPRVLLIRSLRNSHPDALKSADLWSCLTCRFCDEICPSDIKYSELIHLLRGEVGAENFEGTCSHGGILQSLSRIMTAPQLNQDRLDWIDKELQTSKSGEYLYFTGCLPYFDVLFSDLDTNLNNIAKSTLKILNHFNIKPQVLGDERCCGHDFYWNGDFKNFKKLAETNIEMIKKSGAKKIITSCPECYRTLKLDYPKFFGKQDYEITHISEFIADKLEEKKIKLKSDAGKITFQDPCRLGRHLDIYDAPRTVFANMEGVEFKEMAHHHHRSICCGVTGWANCSQVSKQIQTQRLREAHAAGAGTMITACAKCQIHFTCTLQDKKLDQEMNLKIKDITELVAENLH